MKLNMLFGNFIFYFQMWNSANTRTIIKLILACILQVFTMATEQDQFIHVTKCFEMTAVYHKFNDDNFPIYNYTIPPANITTSLKCKNETYFLEVISIIYSYPAEFEEYCIGKNTACKQTKPCSCCTKPTTKLCTQQMNKVKNLCRFAQKNCTVEIPKTDFSECELIKYRCIRDGRNYCVSRWINITYRCSADNPFPTTALDFSITTIPNEVNTAENKTNSMIFIISAFAGVVVSTLLVIAICFVMRRISYFQKTQIRNSQEPGCIEPENNLQYEDVNEQQMNVEHQCPVQNENENMEYEQMNGQLPILIQPDDQNMGYYNVTENERMNTEHCSSIQLDDQNMGYYNVTENKQMNTKQPSLIQISDQGAKYYNINKVHSQQYSNADMLQNTTTYEHLVKVDKDDTPKVYEEIL